MYITFVNEISFFFKVTGVEWHVASLKCGGGLGGGAVRVAFRTCALLLRCCSCDLGGLVDFFGERLQIASSFYFVGSFSLGGGFVWSGRWTTTQQRGGSALDSGGSADVSEEGLDVSWG